MEKKFKNKLAVTGSKSLLKAFEEELISLGYEISKRTFYQKTEWLVNNWNYKINIFSYALGDHPRIQKTEYKLALPRDWDLALRLAAEVEEEIPEYVELLPGFDSQNIGKIFKTSDPIPDLEYWEKSWTWEHLIKSPKKEYFKPSTKEAFEEQNKPTFKEGDWLYSKADHSESIFKFKSFDNLKDRFVTDEYYQIHNTGGLSTGKSDNYTTKDKARLATVEEVKRILTKVAKIKYPIGTRIKPSNLNIFMGSPKSVIITENDFRFYSDVNPYEMWVGSEQWTSIIYENGKWAEIVKEVKVNGYVITKIDDTTVKVGCKTFSLRNLMNLRDFLNSYDGCYYYDGKKWISKDIEKVIDEFLKM